MDAGQDVPKLRGCYELHSTFCFRQIRGVDLGPRSLVPPISLPFAVACALGDTYGVAPTSSSGDTYMAAIGAAGGYARAGRMPARHSLPVRQGGAEAGGCGS